MMFFVRQTGVFRNGLVPLVWTRQVVATIESNCMLRAYWIAEGLRVTSNAIVVVVVSARTRRRNQPRH